MKQLMAIRLYKFSGLEIGELRENYKKRDYFYNHIPKYTINQNNGNFVESEYWLQWVEFSEEYFWLFDIDFIQDPLKEEISQCGWEDFQKDVDFSMIDKIFSRCEYTTFKDYNNTLPISAFLVFDLEYEDLGASDWEQPQYHDYETHIKLEGFLNDKMVLDKGDKIEVLDEK